MASNTINAVELRSLIDAGEEVRLVDVRTGGEFENGHIAGSYHVPLDALKEHRDEFLHVDAPVVLVCQSGGRAAQAADGLADAGMKNVRILEGGISQWIVGGGAVQSGQPRWTLERQVRLVAGGIVLSSIVASVAAPRARFVAGAVGAGLVGAALTNTCAMGNLLSRLPYNKGATCDVRAVVRQLADTTQAEEATS